MTTKQLAAKIKKLFRQNGSILLGLPIQDNDGTAMTMETLCEDQNEIGVSCKNDTWFIPLDELTYSELNKIYKKFNQTKQ